jgi:multiple sugar transport system substrate-binding protein
VKTRLIDTISPFSDIGREMALLEERNAMTRKNLIRAGAVVMSATTAFALAGCSGGSNPSSGGSSDGEISLEISWWGDDARAKLFGEVIDGFEKENPNITVTATPVGSPDDLFNRLATDFAGGGDTAPDVFALGGAKPQEYGELGALLDLSTVSSALDYSAYPDFSLTNAQVGDKLFGLPTGGNATAAFVNADIFEKAGVDVPAEGWTWEDLVEAANTIGSAGLTTDDGKPIYGIDLRIQDIMGTYAGQMSDVGMYDWDGQLGVTADDIAGWYEIEKQLKDGGGLPDPSVVTANWALPPDQQPFTLGQAAITFGYSNLMSSYAVAGDEVDRYQRRRTAAVGVLVEQCRIAERGGGREARRLVPQRARAREADPRHPRRALQPGHARGRGASSRGPEPDRGRLRRHRARRRRRRPAAARRRLDHE